MPDGHKPEHERNNRLRTETTTRVLYTWDELPDDVKEKAVENLRDINLDYEWWDGVYDGAREIGLKITGFDLDRHRHATGKFTLSACEVAANIFRDHGDTCETYKTASDFMKTWQPVFDDYMNEDSENYESRECEEKLMDMENEFLRSLLEDYSIILQHEYEYLYSDEAVIDTIQANKYEFTEKGVLA